MRKAMWSRTLANSGTQLFILPRMMRKNTMSTLGKIGDSVLWLKAVREFAE